MTGHRPHASRCATSWYSWTEGRRSKHIDTFFEVSCQPCCFFSVCGRADSHPGAVFWEASHYSSLPLRSHNFGGGPFIRSRLGSKRHGALVI